MSIVWTIPPSKLCVTFSWQMRRQELSQQTEHHGVPDTVLQPAYSTVHHYTSWCWYKHVEPANKTSRGVPSLIHWSHNWRQIHTKCQYNNLFQEKIRIIIIVLISQVMVKDNVRSRFFSQVVILEGAKRKGSMRVMKKEERGKWSAQREKKERWYGEVQYKGELWRGQGIGVIRKKRGLIKTVKLKDVLGS